MGSLADSLFSEFGLPVLQEQVGEEQQIAYLTALAEEPTGPFDVILEHVATQRVENDDGRKLEHELIAKFPRQDGLPFWSGTNLIGLAATIGGVVWSVDLVQSLSDSLATVRLVRKATSEVSRPGFRRK